MGSKSIKNTDNEIRFELILSVKVPRTVKFRTVETDLSLKLAGRVKMKR